MYKLIKLYIFSTMTCLLFWNIHLYAKPNKLTILSHKVHKTVATSKQGGDITATWSNKNNINVEWVTLGTGPLHERLFRELQLSETSIDIGFIVNDRAVKSVTKFFEPLNDFQKSNPIEDIEDIFVGLRNGMTFNGIVYGIPFRHATSCFHYNKRILNERGVSPPTNIEEFQLAAKNLSFTRSDGSKVYGFVITGGGFANVIDLARAWDGDFISQDYKVKATGKGMMNAINMLHEFFINGVLPRKFAAIKNEEVNTWIQTGRAAMTVASCGRNRIYNDPNKSKESGNIQTVALPVSKDFKYKFKVAPAKTAFWTMIIPKNSKNKDLSWDLLRHMLSKESTLMAAMNGNGPVRASTYETSEMKNKISYASEEKNVLLAGRIPLPPFDNSAKAADIFIEEVQAAVLGMKKVDEAMKSVENRVKPLLP